MAYEGEIHIKEAIYTGISLIIGLLVFVVALSYVWEGTEDVTVAIGWMLGGGFLAIVSLWAFKVTYLWRYTEHLDKKRRIILQIPLRAAALVFLLLAWGWYIAKETLKEILKEIFKSLSEKTRKG